MKCSEQISFYDLRVIDSQLSKIMITFKPRKYFEMLFKSGIRQRNVFSVQIFDSGKCSAFFDVIKNVFDGVTELPDINIGTVLIRRR